MNSFVYTERDLADKIGITAKAARELRRDLLEQDIDWQRNTTGIFYSPSGVARVLAALKISVDAAVFLLRQGPPPAQKIAPDSRVEAKDAAAYGEAVCLRTYPLNARIVLARLGESDVRIRVADSKNFVSGMILPIRRIEGSELWELTRKAPRFRGKW